MAWKGLHLTRPSRLNYSNKQIVVTQGDGEVRLAIEDVAWVILDTQQVSLTGTLLAACLDAGIVLISCDSKHTPCGLALPFHGHFRQPAIAQAQIAMSEPQKKRLWQSIIQRKIENQAAVLAFSAPGEAPALLEMVRWVRSGDPDNVEARAARYYWQRLFPDFKRGDETDRRNKLLNYGYAIVRAAVARVLVAAGLLPAFGLNHSSVTNAFNLADDLVEPFRPFVDRVARELAGHEITRSDDLTVEDRRAMASVLLENACVGGERLALLVAAERTAASLVRAIEAKSAEALELPEVVKIEEAPLDAE
ncbi:MAG TPA: type II CRISPR-associated endonuclease Cas1 [Hyphomicrobium sp.]|nr:type II CRISPR-associated endonuclease Cas1 [Hyphomicrobium sp.]